MKLMNKISFCKLSCLAVSLMIGMLWSAGPAYSYVGIQRMRVISDGQDIYFEFLDEYDHAMAFEVTSLSLSRDYGCIEPKSKSVWSIMFGDSMTESPLLQRITYGRVPKNYMVRSDERLQIGGHYTVYASGLGRLGSASFVLERTNAGQLVVTSSESFRRFCSHLK